jgi:hypothetical protein
MCRHQITETRIQTPRAAAGGVAPGVVGHLETFFANIEKPLIETAVARTRAHHLLLCSIFLDTTSGEFALIHKNLHPDTAGTPLRVSIHLFCNVSIN